jgi:hypothetical protein
VIGIVIAMAIKLDCVDQQKPLCPRVDRTRRAYVTVDTTSGYLGRAPLLFRTRLTTFQC